MIRPEIIEELKAIATDYLKNQNLELVDFAYRYEGRDIVLSIISDRPEGGITLGECAVINKEISRMLYEKYLLQQRYILEVSSPGLDRPLKTKNDFMRCINRTVKVFLSEAIEGKLEWDGIIGKIGEDSVFLEIKDRTIEIPLSRIIKAKQIIIAV